MLFPRRASLERLRKTRADDAKLRPVTSRLRTRLRKAAQRTTPCRTRFAKGKRSCYRRQRGRSLLASCRNSNAIGVFYYKPTMAQGTWGYTQTDEVEKGQVTALWESIMPRAVSKSLKKSVR